MTILRILFWLLATIVVVVTVLIAIANRQPVIFSLQPFPFEMSVPLYAVVFVSVFLGLLLGGLAVKLSALGRRRQPAAADPARGSDLAAAR